MLEMKQWQVMSLQYRMIVDIPYINDTLEQNYLE
jgi:hypothetical protein